MITSVTEKAPPTDPQPNSKSDAVRAALQTAETAWDAQDWLTAGAAYEQALALLPDRLGDRLWYEAALAYKFHRDWDKAYELGKEAARRAEPGQGDPAFWNLGIAATIRRDWATARGAWRGYGIDLPDGDREIEADFGMCCVRIGTGDGGQEVVWVRRLCPTRARVASVPFGERRFGEVVVHDGAPNGTRVAGGHEYPVFDELLLFQASETPSWRLTVTGADPEDVGDLQDRFDEAGFAAEPVETLRFHCKCCSEGTLESGGETPSGAVDVLAAAPDEETVKGLLDEWAGRRPEGRAWHAVHLKV